MTHLVSPANAHSQRSKRLPLLDVARGLALAAMVVFHAGWDISFLGLGLPWLADHPLWQGFGHLIAASFLVLVGISLVLAQGRVFDSLRFFRRLAMIAAAAVLVSLATYIATPDQFIYFGILHHIALASVLALPFLHADLVVVVAAAGLVAGLPMLVSGGVFDAAWLAWLGLAQDPPASSDFVPLLPWFAFVLGGIALARMVDPALFGMGEPQTASTRLLAKAGRHSLLIYLLHQPLLYGGLWLLAQGTLPKIEPQQREFMVSCTRECGANGTATERCNAICACAIDSLKRENLWSEVSANRVSDAMRKRMEEISRSCASAQK